MAVCAHADILNVCMLASMFDDRTYKESIEASYLMSARKIVLREYYIGDSLSSVATHY